jgi:hypothetical protein
MFTDEFLASLSTDPIAGAVTVCDAALHEVENNQSWDYSYEPLMESFALIDGMIEAGMLTPKAKVPTLMGDPNSDSSRVYEYLREVKTECVERASLMKVASMKAHYRAALGAGFAYEFTDGDIERIQGLLNQLRTQVVESNLFEKDHQRRILARLERLQSELHKRTADLDRFWGMIGDAGVAIGKFGKEAKPFVDRILDLTDIIWRAQSRAEELPGGTPTPLLSKPSDHD